MEQHFEFSWEPPEILNIQSWEGFHSSMLGRDETVIPNSSYFQDENPLRVKGRHHEGFAFLLEEPNSASMAQSLDLSPPRGKSAWVRGKLVLSGSRLQFRVADPGLYVEQGVDSRMQHTLCLSKFSFATLQPGGCFRVYGSPVDEPSRLAIWTLKFESLYEHHDWILDIVYQISMLRWFYSRYEFGPEIGRGGFAVVRKCIDVVTGNILAVKVIDTSIPNFLSRARNEIKNVRKIAQRVWHPGIIEVVRIYEDCDAVYIVQQYCSGEELFKRLLRVKRFPEPEAALLLLQIVHALEELHRCGIIHLDVKPENMVFSSAEPNAYLVLTDFGLSITTVRENCGIVAVALPLLHPSLGPMRANARGGSDASDLQSDDASSGPSLSFSSRSLSSQESNACGGSAGYCAPEVISDGRRAVSPAADIFSAGVVLYVLLAGRMPFRGRNKREILLDTVRRNVSMSSAVWGTISEEAKNLIQRMLSKDPKERIRILEILEHPWLRRHCADQLASCVALR